MKRALPKTDSPIRIGFVPLVDVAPIAYAKETGIFARNGLRVELIREPGWATIRDKMAYGELDVVHAPVGLAFALNWGIGVLRQPCLTGYLLNSNGDAITVSRQLYDSGITDVVAFSSLMKSLRRERPFTFAVPHQFSTHHFLLLHWLRPYGIQKGRDVHIVVLPPSLMPDCLASGDIDGYCVGEPFNTLSVRRGCGAILAESAEILPLHPEKALIVSESFQDLDPERHLLLIRSIAEAAVQCETSSGREEVAEILAEGHYLGMDPSLIRSSLFTGRSDDENVLTSASFHVFSHPEVNSPDSAKANWIVAQMRQAGLLERVNLRQGPPINHIFREDIYLNSLETSLATT
ncbi:MAG TPA: ABC transporter substrate-binding protein [Verrucomicrobiales bacterium]|nr:ABC transporter substrate-binding protein [Verrucomicrobiales bacterium]